MNITNIEMTQALAESIGAVLCVITILTIIGNGLTPAVKQIKNCFWLGAILLLSDSGAYIFRGNTETIYLVLTQACNYLAFICNVLLLLFSTRVAYALVRESGVNQISPIFHRIVLGLCSFSGLVIVTNPLTHWMFTFDEFNYYHRGFAWYIYLTASILSLVTVICFAFKYRSQIGRRLFLSIIVYELAPLVMTGFQAFFYGFSFSSFGVEIGLIVVLFGYYSSDANRELFKTGRRRHVRSIALFLSTSLIILSTMVGSIISCVLSFDSVLKEKNRQDRELLTQLVRNTVEKELLKPIMVSEALAQSSEIIYLFDPKQNYGAEQIAGRVSDCMSLLQQAFGYQMVFAASEAHHAYYTYKGLSKYLDIDHDLKDAWYKEFTSAGVPYLLNIDDDEVNNWTQSVFVNTEIRNRQGDFLGICGVGIDMKYLQNILREYESTYPINIKLINKAGLVQVSSSTEEIETLTLPAEYLGNQQAVFSGTGPSDYSSGEPASFTTYINQGNSFIQSTYLPDLDWFLVISEVTPSADSLGINIFPSVSIFFIGLMITMVIYWLLILRNRDTSKQLKANFQMSITDQLTGLLNRRAYELDIAKLKQTNPPSTLSIILMDVNGLKTVNDTVGHDAGDELLIGAADCIRNTFANYGDVYRIGGDEFVAIVKTSSDEIREIMVKLDSISQSWKGNSVAELSISKGLASASDHPDFSVAELIKMADKLMYEDKNAYYRRTGKDRRMTW